MLFLSLIFVIAGILFSVPAWHLGRHKVKWSKWDYAIPIYSNILGLVMTLLSFDSPYMDRFGRAAMFAFVLSLSLPWLRLSIKKLHNSAPFWLYFLPIVGIIFLTIQGLFFYHD